MMFVGIVAIASLLTSFQTKSQDKEVKKNGFNSQFPVANYNAPNDPDLERGAKRRLKSSRYDNRSSSVISSAPRSDDEQSVLISDAFESIPGLPVAESEIIVVGIVLEASAYVSNNKKGVYSEFSFRIDEVLKTGNKGLIKGGLVAVDREGGYVQYENGKKRLYRLGGLSMPLVGRKYVLFLKNPEKTPNYEIVSGYELKTDCIGNLNGSEQSMAYSDMDEATFMNALYRVVADWAKGRQ